MAEWFTQGEYGVRFEWGTAGAEWPAPRVDCLMATDVLSFSMSVTVAADADTSVFPIPGVTAASSSSC